MEITEKAVHGALNAKDEEIETIFELTSESKPNYSSGELRNIQKFIKDEAIEAAKNGDRNLLFAKQLELRNFPLQILAAETEEISQKLREIEIEMDLQKENQAALIETLKEKNRILIPLLDATMAAKSEVAKVEQSLFVNDETRKGLIEQRRTLKARRSDITKEIQDEFERF